MVILFQVSK